MSGTRTWTSPLTDLLFEDPGVGRCLVAPDGSVLRANSEWLRSTGFTLDDVLGADIIDLFPETRDMALAMHDRARAGHRVGVSRHAQRVQGRETWWDGMIAPVPMEHGTGLLITAREITERMVHDIGVVRPVDAALPNDSADLHLLMGSVKDYALFMLDTEGRVTSWNSGAERIKGYRAEEIVGQHFSRFYTPEDVAARKPDAELKAAGTTGRFEDEGWRVRKDGSRFWANVVISRAADPSGRVLGFAKVTRDLSDRKRSDDELRESEEKFRGLFNWMGEGTQLCELILDERGHPADVLVCDVNPAYERHSGIRREQVVGRRIKEILPVVEQAWLDRYGELVRTGTTSHFEEYNASLGKWFEVFASPMGGKRFAAVFSDITERKRTEEALRESEDRFRALVTASSDVVYRMSPDWSEMRQLQGRSFIADTEAPSGAWLQKYIHPDDQARVMAAIREAIRTKSIFELEHRVLRVDGSLGWTFSRAIPRLDTNGEIVEWFGAASDVTERKDAENDLREADRRKTEFLAVLSHELRNPLAPIRNSIYLLERAAPGSEQAARAKAVVRRQTEHLTRLVDELLDVTRISRGKIDLHRTRVDVRDIVRQNCDDLHSLFEQGEIEMRLDLTFAPLWVDADATRITQAIGNLLQNALKFTPPGGKVVVDVAGRDDRAEITVRDTGVGIEPGDLDRMFEPFAQADQGLARTQGGLGLGLALTRGLVELHGGSVRGHSKGKGSGSEFIVSLPLAPASAARPAVSLEACDAATLVVLLIEDNVDAAQSLAEIVELQGYTVRIAYDGKTGIMMANDLKPDVVLCDIGLPDMNGYDVARELRRRDAHGGMRLFAITGYAQPEDKQRATEAGFDAHVPKPPPLDELNKLLAEVARNKG